MTIVWLEKKIKEFYAQNGVNPRCIEISNDDMYNILVDVNWGIPSSASIKAGFMCNGVSITPGPVANGGAIFYTHAGGMEYMVYSEGGPGIVSKKCDCGAEKCGSPGHSTWCSTQVSA